MRIATAIACTLLTACAGGEIESGGEQLDASISEDGGDRDGTTIPPGDAIAFADAGPPLMTPCTGQPDGTVCVAAPSGCYAPALCTGGLCGGLTTMANGTVCDTAPDVCHADGTCTNGNCGAATKRADGYNWNAGEADAICCDGDPIVATSDTSCGACGIACNASNGESCQKIGGHSFCGGCVASADCWSHCCSESFTPNACAASDCNGSCSSTYCPTGSHCVSGAPTSSDYCAY